MERGMSFILNRFVLLVFLVGWLVGRYSLLRDYKYELFIVRARLTRCAD